MNFKEAFFHNIMHKVFFIQNSNSSINCRSLLLLLICINFLITHQYHNCNLFISNQFLKLEFQNTNITFISPIRNIFLSFSMNRSDGINYQIHNSRITNWIRINYQWSHEVYRKYNFCLCLIKPASDKARLIELIGDEAIGDGSNSVAKHGDLLVAEVVVDVEGLALIEIPCSLGIPAPRRKSMPKRFRRVANETEAECRALTRRAEW